MRGNLNRRRYLEIVGAGSVVGIAGCTGDNQQAQNSTQKDKAPGSKGQKEENTQGGHLRISIPRTTSTLSPVMMGSKFTERWAVKMFYSTLTRLDSDLKAYGDLATDWKANKNADTWTFTLQDNATFHHNNKKVTAEDVKATFETIYDEKVGSPGRDSMGKIKKVEKVDEKTVRFNLERANSDFPKLVSKGWGSIAPKNIITNKKKRKSMGSNEYGSGAYTLENFEPGNSVTGSRYKNYYRTSKDGTQLPYTDKVTQKTISEPNAQLSALQNKEIDIMWEPPIKIWDRLTDIDQVSTDKTSSGSIYNFVMDVSVEPWKDPKVRQAVMWAIDREAIINTVVSGLGSPGNDTPLSSAYEYSADIKTRSQDIKKAKKLLKEAGYPNGFDLNKDFDLTFQCASSPDERVETAVAIQEQLKEIGITFDINQISYDKYISDVLTQAPFYMAYYGMRISAANFMRLLLHSEGGWNAESHFSDPKFDKAITNAVSAVEPKKKQKSIKKAAEIVHDHGPYAVPFFQDVRGAANKYVNNYDVSPLTFQFYPDEYALDSSAPTK